MASETKKHTRTFFVACVSLCNKEKLELKQFSTIFTSETGALQTIYSFVSTEWFTAQQVREVTDFVKETKLRLLHLKDIAEDWEGNPTRIEWRVEQLR
jgi:hypothetical protein